MLHKALEMLDISVSRLRDDRGAALVEWGLLVVLIAVVAMLALTAVGIEVSNLFGSIPLF